MTVVVGAVSGDDVWLAGDSYCGDEDILELCTEPKVFAVSNTVALGISGDVRAEILTTKAIKKIIKGKERITQEWLKTDFSLKLHDALKDTGVLKEKNSIHTLEDSSFVLAHAGRLYYLDDNLGLWRPQAPYVAIGSGRSLALGALAYAYQDGDLEEHPKEALKEVLDCVSKHCHYVRPPYTYVKI